MSYRSWLFAGAVALASVAGLGSAFAESRVALVIGNSSYQSVPALPNPANDSKAMADLLRSADFEVITARDLGQSEMRRAFGDFARTIAGKGSDTVALVYYAGHGVQVDGDNYLVPIDAQIRQEADVPLQTVRLADLMNALAAVKVKTRIVMLDACRNNPFSEIGKSGGRGLAIVDAPAGSIVSYATAPGSEAEDGEGRNSPYTAAFLTVAREPGLPIEQAFKKVRYSVHQATDGRQIPWESSSLTGDFAFFGGGAQTTGVATTASGPAVAGTQVASLGGGPVTRSTDGWRGELQSKSAREAYEIVIREDQPEAYQAFVELFPAETFTPRVRSLLDRRQELLAWHDAVTINTAAAYRAFLAEFPNSDYAGTAQRLVERTGRSLGATDRDRACGTPVIRRRADLSGPTRHALIDPTPSVTAVVAPVVSAPAIIAPAIIDHGPFGRHGGLPPIIGKPDGKPPVIVKPPVVVKPLPIKPVVTKPLIDKPKFVARPIVSKPQFVARPVTTGPRMVMGGGGGMRFGGGGFGRR
ncbi:MAG: caspase family protein [Rhodoplanes sp.]|uniref:caspase family protein n=1 Tax=Rhodoplanes sp. TaxID=1968906 RepID=UPI0017FA2E78|nr:caspase family protein [Rhodoplanes sp.]NVO15999.1 caspase family protein [Rhodoplanes sp.]